MRQVAKVMICNQPRESSDPDLHRGGGRMVIGLMSWVDVVLNLLKPIIRGSALMGAPIPTKSVQETSRSVAQLDDATP